MLNYSEFYNPSYNWTLNETEKALTDRAGEITAQSEMEANAEAKKEEGKSKKKKKKYGWIRWINKHSLIVASVAAIVLMTVFIGGIWWVKNEQAYLQAKRDKKKQKNKIQ